ncbi:MAG: 3'(2'),5'-bisphosphate nucleotidase CysQ [Pseudomarimonas sp.]
MSERFPVEAVIALVREAGAAIMAVYASDFAVEHKDDRSPLTAADRAAHHVLDAGLVKLTGELPVLSEESATIDWQVRQAWSRYWLVDPLDGTREFVKRNGEFTVNVALIEDGAPVFGVVQAPVTGDLWWGGRSFGAYRREADGSDTKLQSARPAPAHLRVAASRSHLDARTQALLDKLGAHDRLGLGSSLKFCRLAEGLADVYPRFGPTSEWDTAAAQCVLEGAGGIVIDTHGRPLRCNQGPSLLNGDFLALGDPKLPWSTWL